jgi:ABC-type transporter Mla maintaining outer membrane lipid asymmetry ATPase subunit MlaF
VSQIVYVEKIQLLDPNQAAMLTAIAQKGVVETPTSMEFMIKHQLSALSTVRQSLGVLLEKEVVHQAPEGYRVTDVFFRHWLAGG